MGILSEEVTLPQKHTNQELYEKQLKMLRDFLDRGAISEEQYQVSVNGLKAKMKL